VPPPASCHIPSPLDTVPTVSSLTHIPLLMGRSDWIPWSDQVGSTLLALDLILHICDPPEPGMSFDIHFVPAYPPHHDEQSIPEELAAYCLWY
jgi:hypothetical protein